MCNNLARIKIVYYIYPDNYRFCCTLFSNSQVSLLYHFLPAWRTFLSISFRTGLLVTNCLHFLHLRMSLFCLYSRGIFFHNTEFHVDSFVLFSALRKYGSPYFCPWWFWWEISTHLNHCFPICNMFFLSGYFQDFFFYSLIFSSKIILK